MKKIDDNNQMREFNSETYYQLEMNLYTTSSEISKFYFDNFYPEKKINEELNNYYLLISGLKDEDKFFLGKGIPVGDKDEYYVRNIVPGKNPYTCWFGGCDFVSPPEFEGLLQEERNEKLFEKIVLSYEESVSLFKEFLHEKNVGVKNIRLGANHFPGDHICDLKNLIVARSKYKIIESITTKPFDHCFYTLDMQNKYI